MEQHSRISNTDVTEISSEKKNDFRKLIPVTLST